MRPSGRLHDPVRHVVTAGDAPEDVEEDRLHVRIGGDDLERRDHLLRIGRASDVQEVGGLPPVVLDQIHRGHGQTGPVHTAANVAVQLHEGKPRLPSLGLGGGLRARVPQLLEPRQTPQATVVDAHLGVDRLDLPRVRHDQRIDLGHRAGVLGERTIEERDDPRGLFGEVRIRVEEICESIGLMTQKPVAWIHAEPQDRLGVRGGHLFDVHAPFRRDHEHRRLAGPVHEDPDVGFRSDLLGRRDQDLSHGEPLDLHAQDVGGVIAGLLGVLRELHASRLPPSPGVHLCLYDDGTPQIVSDPLRLVRTGGDLSLGNRDPNGPQELLRLILVDIHRLWCADAPSLSPDLREARDPSPARHFSPRQRTNPRADCELHPTRGKWPAQATSAETDDQAIAVDRRASRVRPARRCWAQGTPPSTCSLRIVRSSSIP